MYEEVLSGSEFASKECGICGTGGDEPFAANDLEVGDFGGGGVGTRS
jgi:hypothetical protein